jgi:crotonobetainyl-CoA:carnitine CoA-transferase CaiB-like acyl-CoA transferase
LDESYFEYTRNLFDRSDLSLKSEALRGIRVLDLSRIIFGPVVGKWLGLFGAEIVKVEEPDEGDQWRTASYWAKYWKDSSPYFQTLNPNKLFIAIDLKTKRGKELILELARQSDVVVENFRAGLAEAWGIGYTSISKVNPKVIYISCCGYGQFGPLRFFPSWDLIAQSMSGVARLTGFPGHDTYKLPDYYGDFFPGICAAMSVMTALNYRERTGKGQLIDMAQAEALMRTMLNWTYMSVEGQDMERTGNTDPSMAPSGIFATRDERYVGIAIATDKQLLALLKAMGNEELAKDSKYVDTFERLQSGNADVLDKAVEEWAKDKTLDEILGMAKQYGFPAADVKNDLELANDPWRKERGSVVEFNDEMYGSGTWPGVPVALNKTPGRIKNLSRPVGYHNRHIFKEMLGMSREGIKELEEAGIIGYWSNRVGERPPSYYDIENDPVFNNTPGAENERE